MWSDNDKLMEIFDMKNNRKTHFPFACPICNKETAHVYIHGHDDRHCGIWAWCSSCGSYAHMSGELPSWWKNPDFIDAEQLYAEPDYLETLSDKIDTWVNSIVPDKEAFSENSLVMENKFKVKLLVNYQDMPAGTTGTIVIRDDFRTITIDFINTEGKTINLKIQPDKITSIFEVIN